MRDARLGDRVLVLDRYSWAIGRHGEVVGIADVPLAPPMLTLLLDGGVFERVAADLVDVETQERVA
jgi:hypothetical protein